VPKFYFNYVKADLSVNSTGLESNLTEDSLEFDPILLFSEGISI